MVQVELRPQNSEPWLGHRSQHMAAVQAQAVGSQPQMIDVEVPGGVEPGAEADPAQIGTVHVDVEQTGPQAAGGGVAIFVCC